MRSGYYQLLLDPESRHVSTFSSPWGNYRPRRVIFGAKVSQDMLDKTIFRIFGDIHILLDLLSVWCQDDCLRCCCDSAPQVGLM